MSEEKRDQADRGFIDWTPRADSRVMVEQILSVIQNYRDQGVPAPTVRDVMYEVRSRYGYKKTDAFRRKVYRLLSKMRRAGMIGFDEIDDDSPTMLTERGYDDPAQFWRGVRARARVYVRDLTQGQLYRVIVLTEGAGKVRQFRTVSGRYDIPVYSGGGWESLKLKHNLAKEAADEYRDNGRATLALHCGDFDPDGEAIFAAGVEDVRAFIATRFLPDEDAEEVFQVERLMLTRGQAEQLPDEDKDYIDRSKIKAKDWRGQKWPYDYKCELEALRIPDRLAILRERIEQLVDQDQVTAVQAEADSERKGIMGKIDALEDGALVPDEGHIPADVVDFVKTELDLEIGTRIWRVVGYGRQSAVYSGEMKQRIARRWLRGE
jgi:hypothetical protein